MQPATFIFQTSEEQPRLSQTLEEDDDDIEDAEENDVEDEEEDSGRAITILHVVAGNTKFTFKQNIKESEIGEERVPTPKAAKDADDDLDTDQETDRLLGQQYNDDNGYFDSKVRWSFCFLTKHLSFSINETSLLLLIFKQTHLEIGICIIMDYNWQKISFKTRLKQSKWHSFDKVTSKQQSIYQHWLMDKIKI